MVYQNATNPKDFQIGAQTGDDFKVVPAGNIMSKFGGWWMFSTADDAGNFYLSGNSPGYGYAIATIGVPAGNLINWVNLNCTEYFIEDLHWHEHIIVSTAVHVGGGTRYVARINPKTGTCDLTVVDLAGMIVTCSALDRTTNMLYITGANGAGFWLYTFNLNTNTMSAPVALPLEIVSMEVSYST